MDTDKEKLISLEDFIARAKRFGVDFGKGDPKNRLRYYVKSGLLPHAQRKSFNGAPPNGAYSEKVLTDLLDIDKKIKQGKTVREIKEENENKAKQFKKVQEEKPVFEKRLPKIVSPLAKKEEQQFSPALDFKILPTSAPEKSFPFLQKQAAAEREDFSSWQNFKNQNISQSLTKTPLVFKIVFSALIITTLVFFINAKINLTDSISYYLARIIEFSRLAQAPETFLPEEETFTLASGSIEPYLTINAETDINAPLTVKEKISSPFFAIVRDEFEGSITAAGLTENREYLLPDSSGTICLTTGNCIGLAGEVVTDGGTVNRLVKFISGQEIADSSIIDLYLAGTAITIDELGNIGIGTDDPRAKLDVRGDIIAEGDIIANNRIGIGIDDPLYELHVQGQIQASGDICTDLAGGRCLSTLPIGGGGGSRAAGLGGSGTAGYVPIWTAATALGNSAIFQSAGNIGIGTSLPQEKLDVAGTVKMLGFQLGANATSGYVLTADDFGIGTWQALPAGVLPSGSIGQTLRYDGATWAANSFFYNSGTAIGIGTTTPLATLTVDGDGFFQGPLTIESSALNQFLLKYDDNNYLRFSIDSSQSELLSSKTMVINSLTGEVMMGSDVTVFDAAGAEVRGRTFISSTTDSTVRKTGEKVFRSSIPIFLFSVPAQTNSNDFIAVSRDIYPSELNAVLPETLPGSSRKFAFLINFADDILPTASSTWLVDVSIGSDTEFYFSGQDLASFDEGVPYLSEFVDPPANNWQLKVKVPIGNTIRIFNILLLVYDEIN